MIRIENLNVFRGQIQVLHDVSLCVAQGEIFALVGSNGAGKTSFLMALSGLLPISSGKVTLHTDTAALDICRSRAEQIVAAGLVHCPEGRQVFTRMTIEENLRLGAYLNDNKDRVADLLDNAYSLFPVLKERRRLIAGGLSGGEQMMLALARSLMAEPRLLLLDEPSLGLAPQITEQIFEILAEINKQNKVTIILIEQNAMRALDLADRGAVLTEGRISDQKPAAALLNDSEVVSAYLGAG